MALRSIEPVELVGCACDGYNQVERMIVARFEQVEAVALPAPALAGLDDDARGAVTDAAAALARAGVSVIVFGDSCAAIDDVAALPGLPAVAMGGAAHDGAERMWREIASRCRGAGASAERVLVAGLRERDISLMGHAWLSVALRGAGEDVVGAADAQSSYAGGGHAVADLLLELAERRGVVQRGE